MSSTKSYGVNQQNSLNSKIDGILEELQINGYSVLENILNETELTEVRLRLDTVYEKQVSGFGLENLEKINEKNTVRSPLVYDDYFLQIAVNPKILEIIENILGSYYILHLQNGIINKPNEMHHQTSWHRDLPYQNFVISKPLAIGALFCIDDFTEASGGTFVLPHSHKVEKIPSNEYILKFEKQLSAKAGSVIIFDSMLFHRAGYNSANFTRRAINNVYVVPILKQQINLFKALNGKFSNDPFLSKFLGYSSNTPDTDIDWRKEKLSR